MTSSEKMLSHPLKDRDNDRYHTIADEHVTTMLVLSSSPEVDICMCLDLVFKLSYCVEIMPQGDMWSIVVYTLEWKPQQRIH